MESIDWSQAELNGDSESFASHFKSELEKMYEGFIPVLMNWVLHHVHTDNCFSYCQEMIDIVKSEYKERMDDVYMALEEADRENRLLSRMEYELNKEEE